jgi:hypothetical protein
MERELKASDTLQIVEIEGLCRYQLILTARLARTGTNIDRSEELLSELKDQLRALRSARAEMRKISGGTPRRSGANIRSAPPAA